MAAGDVYRSGNYVRTSGNQFEGIPQDTGVYYLENEDIRWNLNRCEVVVGSARLPARVNWYAALTFARYYGYDLPTDAEWEKAARGPDHDDLGEHWLYPWGNTISTSTANLSSFYAGPELVQKRQRAAAVQDAWRASRASESAPACARLGGLSPGATRKQRR